MPARSDFPDSMSPTSSPPIPQSDSPSPISSRKLPKFLQNRSKASKAQDVPVPISSSTTRPTSLADSAYLVDTSPTPSTSSEESTTTSPRFSPLSRNRSASKSSGSSPLPVPHRPSSPSPLHHRHDASLPSKLSSWMTSTSVSVSLPQIITTHSHITKHLSLPTPHKRGRLSIGGGSAKSSLPSSPASDSSSINSAMGTTPSRKGRPRQMLDKALQYILDSDASRDGSIEDIWLMGQLYSYTIVEGLPVSDSPTREFPLRSCEDDNDATPSAEQPPSARRHSLAVPSSSTRRRAEGGLSSPPAHLRASTRGSVGSTSSNSSPPHHATSDSDASATNTASPRKSRFLHHSRRQSTSGIATPSTPAHLPTPPATSSGGESPSPYFPVMVNGYPIHFFEDFSSRIWLTYRGGWELPLRADSQLGDLPSPAQYHRFSSIEDSSPSLSSSFTSPSSASQVSSLHSTATQQHQSPPKNLSTSASSLSTQNHTSKWGNNLLATFGIGSKEFTSDAGWGCMLRTGQCVLAEALSRIHLGRDFRRQNLTTSPALKQSYMRLLSWFMDTPSPSAPFSVHRMALAGKAFGKDVGTWFGPSTAAGAIKTLVGAFPDCGLGVCVAEDGMLYETDVLGASRSPLQWSTKAARRHRRHQHRDSGSSGSASTQDWGDRPVLVLAGIRLGLDGVNPVYYPSLKKLYTIPQGVGIAGGRPSSSYWFIGVQGNSLIYLDPHHTRPALSSVSNFLSTFTSSSTTLSTVSSSPQSHNSSSGGDVETSESFNTTGVEDECMSYHCDKVRKMKLSAMDPSMLVGFIVKDRKEWDDLRSRISELPKSIGLYIQDEPPAWRKEQDLKEEEQEDEEDDSVLESISDSASEDSPKEVEVGEGEEEERQSMDDQTRTRTNSWNGHLLKKTSTDSNPHDQGGGDPQTAETTNDKPRLHQEDDDEFDIEEEDLHAEVLVEVDVQSRI